jgi:hypothetical protein
MSPLLTGSAALPLACSICRSRGTAGTFDYRKVIVDRLEHAREPKHNRLDSGNSAVATQVRADPPPA